MTETAKLIRRLSKLTRGDLAAQVLLEQLADAMDGELVTRREFAEEMEALEIKFCEALAEMRCEKKSSKG